MGRWKAHGEFANWIGSAVQLGVQFVLRDGSTSHMASLKLLVECNLTVAVDRVKHGRWQQGFGEHRLEGFFRPTGTGTDGGHDLAVNHLRITINSKKSTLLCRVRESRPQKSPDPLKIFTMAVSRLRPVLASRSGEVSVEGDRKLGA